MIDLARQKGLSHFQYTKGDMSLTVHCGPSSNAFYGHGIPPVHHGSGYFMPHGSYGFDGTFSGHGSSFMGMANSGQSLSIHENPHGSVCYKMPPLQHEDHQKHDHSRGGTNVFQSSGGFSEGSLPKESQKPSGKPVTSPLVGTVYVAPREGANPFVSLGDHVKEGQVLFIVEAMKIMNPIKAPWEGKIVSIDVQNGAPVEFQEILAHIEVLS